MRKTLPALLALILFMSMSKDKPAYKIYTSKGKEVSFGQLVNEAKKADIVLFGELHNNPIVHWLQLELTKTLHEELGNKLALGAEMFETDNSLIISEYLAGKVNDRNFESEARLWPNYQTDYKPLLQYARDNQLNFVATNIPRRYAALVNREGLESLDSLSSAAKSLIAPLPIEYDGKLSGYKAMLDMMAGSGHVNTNLPKAQAIKDATMSHFILQNFTKGEQTFLHFHGTYHSDDYQGIMWYLQKTNPGLKILTIHSTEAVDIEKIDDEISGKADFLIVTPEIMTKTH
jgi:uncharacterized iron-regulated protein